MQNFAPPLVEQDLVGVNNNLPPETLSTGYFAVANNVLLSDNKIAKVAGSVAIASSIGAYGFNGVAEFENLTSGNKYIVANMDGASVSQAYQWNGSGSFSAIAGLTSTNGAAMGFETAGNYIFGMDGVNVWDWDGTTATKNRAGIPLGSFLSWFHNYLFVAGDPAHPNRLYWSNLGDPLTFNGANFVDVNAGDGDKIVGFGQIQDELLVLKRNTIWSITGFSGTTFSATTIATQNTNNRIVGYGCVAPQSVLSTGKDVYFMSFLGDYPVVRSLTKTQFAVTLSGGIISNDIDGTMKTITKTAIGQIAGIFDGRFCRWAIPTNSSTTNNAEIILDTYQIRKRSGSTLYPWTTTSGKNVNNYAISTIGGFANVYFADEGSTGLILKIDQSIFTDKGANIAIDVQTRAFMPDPARKHKWKYVYFRFDTEPTTMTISAKIDESLDFTTQEVLSLAGSSPGLGPTGMFTLGVSQLGGATRTHHRTTLLHLIGKTLQLQYTESSNVSVAIYDQEIYQQSKGLRAN